MSTALSWWDSGGVLGSAVQEGLVCSAGWSSLEPQKSLDKLYYGTAD